MTDPSEASKGSVINYTIRTYVISFFHLRFWLPAACLTVTNAERPNSENAAQVCLRDDAKGSQREQMASGFHALELPAPVFAEPVQERVLWQVLGQNILVRQRAGVRGRLQLLRPPHGSPDKVLPVLPGAVKQASRIRDHCAGWKGDIGPVCFPQPCPIPGCDFLKWLLA